jgi:hypothetical protein
MDDVDAVQAQIARNMLQSGDWVTARLDGVAYLEKAPLIYWIMAVSYKICGVSDWAARLPLALINVALCWVTARFAQWGFGKQTGALSGVILATCVGMFLFTRILIPDAALTLAITVVLWAYLRLTSGRERHAWLWVGLLYSSLAGAVLLKGLIGVIFPAGIITIHLLCCERGGLLNRVQQLRPLSGGLLFLLIAAPWHVLATLRNPPYFAWTLVSHAGNYHGFFWFYFLNEHLLRFLNLRYPRDYNTVPRIWFWLLHAVWFFPWSAALLMIFRLSYWRGSHTGRIRWLLAIWSLFVLAFFTFSTTQEYYSLPIYPAVSMLIANALAERGGTLRTSRILLVGVFSVGLGCGLWILTMTAKMPTPGDISFALAQHPDLYTLSLGHVGDLTIRSFAYLRGPLVLACLAMALGIRCLLAARSGRIIAAVLCLTMLVFLQGARLALVAFDPYLGSKPLADALTREPPGLLVEADAYYAFSSVFFYTNRQALLWNGRINNLEYGSNAPGAPKVFIGDATLKELWLSPPRVYLLARGDDMPNIKKLLGHRLVIVAQSGGNYLLTNDPDR